MEPFVTQSWLRDHLDDPDVQVVDCRYVLGQSGVGRDLYLDEHIAGATFLDLDRDLAGPVGDGRSGRHPLPSPQAFTAAARRAGISAGTRVVAYDENMTGGAARLWWLLRHFGHDDVAVLADGLDAWSGPTRSGDERPSPGNFTARPRTGDVVEVDDVLAGLGRGGRVLVDARAPERFRGEVEPIDPVPGRIPGAVNVPFTGSAEVPAGGEDEIVVYCGSGVSACVVLLRLAADGREDAKLYPGSYSEWANRGLPVERST